MDEESPGLEETDAMSVFGTVLLKHPPRMDEKSLKECIHFSNSAEDSNSNNIQMLPGITVSAEETLLSFSSNDPGKV